MNRNDALDEMVHIQALCVLEARERNDDEAARWAELRLNLTTPKDEPMETEVIDLPVGAVRAFAGQQHRTLSDAVLEDGLAARVHANGKARTDVPGLSLRAIGSDQAVSPAPGIVVPVDNRGISSGYIPPYGRLLDAMGTITTTSNAILYQRLAYATGGNAAAKVQELAGKPESVLQSTPVTQVIDTWAHLIRASNQILDDVSGLRALLDTTLTEGLKDKVDLGAFAAMTTSGHYTAYAATAGDTIADAIARIATVLRNGGASGVKIAVNPATLLTVSLAKDTTGRYLGLPPNIPGSIIPVAAVPVGNLLAWSDAGAVWAEREGISVVAGLDSDDFSHNRLTLRCECRGSVLTLDSRHVAYGPATA